jgi:CrcB protein
MAAKAAAASSEAERPGEEGGVGEADGHVGGSAAGRAPESLLSRRVWVEPVDSVLYLLVFGLLGTLLRCGLVRLFTCFSTAFPGASCRSLDDGGVLFVTLAPNMLGCFIIGLLSTTAATGGTLSGTSALAALPASHRWQRCATGPRITTVFARAGLTRASHRSGVSLARLHLGLRTGFCGSLTTWAAWNQVATERIVTGDWARGLMTYLFGAELAACSSMMGTSLAAALRSYHDGAAGPDQLSMECSVDDAIGEPAPPPLLSKPTMHFCAEDVAATLVLAGVAGAMVAGIAASPSMLSRELCLSALFGPAGVLLRWQLSRLNARWPRAPWLSLGTLAANTLGCILAAAVSAAISRRRLSAYWQSVVGAALVSGLAGGLSTVSTVASEAAMLMHGSKLKGYAYLALTLVCGFGPAALIGLAGKR